MTCATIHTEPSATHPGWLSVTIAGPSLDAVQAEIWRLEDEGYTVIRFTLPAPCQDGSWAAHGRVAGKQP